MGIIGLLKEMSAFRKVMKEELAAQARKKEMYQTLSVGELQALTDEDLFAAALSRTETIVDHADDIAAGFSALTQPQKVLYAVNYLEMEVNNGGLCQFFVNSSRFLAPYISEYLGIIGAVEHKALFDGFIGKHQIDVTDLSSFIVHRVKDYEAQTLRYPFEEYDDRFYTLSSLEEPLTAYIRAHIESF